MVAGGVNVATVMLLSLLPAGTMVFGSIVVTFFQPGPKLTSAMQHFAAGIVLGAVALELAPQVAIMNHKQNGVFTIAMLLGFFTAVSILMLISRYFDADDDDEDDDPKKEKDDNDLKKPKQIESFTSATGVSSPTTSINLDIGSNKSTAYNSPMSTPPRSPNMNNDQSLDISSANKMPMSMPGAMGNDAAPRWSSAQQPNNNNNNWNNNNNNNNNNWNNNNNNMNNNWNNNNNTRARDNSSAAGSATGSNYGGRGFDRISETGSDVSASSYSNNSQTPLTRGANSSVSGTPRPPPKKQGYGNQGGYGNNNNNWNNNQNQNLRAGPYPPPPAPPSMPAPESDWNGNDNNNNNNGNGNGNWSNNNNNNWGNNRGYGNGNMYNNGNWNTRTRQRGVSNVSTHMWQPRVRYAAQWKNSGRSDMGYVPPPPPRRNQFRDAMNNGNQWGNNNMNNGMNNNNNNGGWDNTHTRMPSYMLHGMATTGLAKSMARNSLKATTTAFYNTTLNTDVTKPGTVAAPAGAFTIPWGLIVAVAVDATTDGILIGVASAVGQGGLVVAIALAIEMSFLGISTSIEMSEMNVNKITQIPILLILPGFILVGSAIGATVMAGVTGPLFVAFLSFGAAALLFLVTEELLISAHEDLAHDTWYVSLSFFVGFIIVLIMDQFSGPNMCIDAITKAFEEQGLPVPAGL